MTPQSGTMGSMAVDDQARAAAAREAGALASRYGLTRIGTRPPLGDYLRSLWTRRHFTRVLATSKAYSRHENTHLGQLWGVINPLLNAAVYYAIFGLLLSTRGGVDNFVGFLVVGVFMFRFTATSITAGAKSIMGNLTLVRSLHFPRAVLPAAVVLAELTTLMPAIAVMLVIVLATGEPVTWYWLFLPGALALQWLFNTGCAFIAARLVVDVRDLLNVLPFLFRMAFYLSGVLYLFETYVTDERILSLLPLNPFFVYLTLPREYLLASQDHAFIPELWLAAVLWAVVSIVAGLVFFRGGEKDYGRG